MYLLFLKNPFLLPCVSQGICTGFPCPSAGEEHGAGAGVCEDLLGSFALIVLTLQIVYTSFANPVLWEYGRDLLE